MFDEKCKPFCVYIHMNAEIIVRHSLTRSFRVGPRLLLLRVGSNDVHFSFSAFSIKATRLEVHASICQKTLAFL